MDPRFDPPLARAVVVDPAVGLAVRERFLLQAVASKDEIQHAPALSAYGYLLESVGRIREARVAFERAAKENPLDQRPRLESAFLAAWLGNIEEARHISDEMRGRAPDFDVDTNRVWTEMWFGDGAIAKGILNRIKVEGARRYAGPECMALFADARAAHARPSEADIERACGADNDIVFAYFGYLDAAFRGVGTYQPPDSSYAGYTSLFMPHMRLVRADPRFMLQAARLGLVDYWLDTDQWPDFCTTDKLPYDCKQAALAARADASGTAGSNPGSVAAHPN
jgi:tetratricopeptide (TPR) repeat protein